MKFSMQSGATVAELSDMRWDVALHGVAIDERGRDACAFVGSRSDSTFLIGYDADSFEISIDNVRIQIDDIQAALPDLAKSTVVLESTSLGFAEVFLLSRALVNAGAIAASIVYVEPIRYNRPRRGEVLYRRDFELSSEVMGYRAIPGAALMFTDRRPQRGVFFLGFEERRLDVALEDFQNIRPEDCSVVFGVPAYRPGWELDAFANNVGVIEAKGVTGGVHFCGAENPAAAFEILSDIREALTPGGRMFVAPIGTKPNGIGAALFAATDQSVGLLYDHPKKILKRSESVSRWHLYNVTF